MSPVELDLDRRLGALRTAFDRAFAEPSRHATGDTEDLLAIRVAGDPYALRVGDLTGLVADRKIAPLPSSRTELAGMAGIRGALVPVYTLSSLLGYGVRATAARWLALCGRSDPMALAFEELEGFLRVSRADIYRAGTASASKPHLGEIARIGTLTRTVVSTRSIVETLQGVAGTAGTTKEG